MAKKKAKPVTLKFAVGEKVYTLWAFRRTEGQRVRSVYEVYIIEPVEHISVDREGVWYHIDGCAFGPNEVFRTKREASAAMKALNEQEAEDGQAKA